MPGKIDRRTFVGLASAGLAAAALPAAEAATHETAEGAGNRPNFLFMIADDLTFRVLHSVNNPEIHTPNLDRLAASGCVFTHCFQQGSWMPAVCAPSRTMLTSGLSAFHAMQAARRLSSYQPNDIDDLQSVLLPATLSGAPSQELELSLGDYPMWGQTMRAAGYDTYLCGKWHVDDVSMQRSFSEMGPDGPGMYRSTGINGSAYHRPRADGTDSWNPADPALHGHWLDTGLIRDGKPGGPIRHSSEFYADEVIDYLGRAVQRHKPFFIYLGWNAPHDPRQSPQEFLDMYPADKIAVPPNFLPEHPFDEGDHRVRDEQLAPWPRTPHMVQTHRREYYAIVSHMDRQIGRILDALERSGKAKNTYVIMTADHGLSLGEHGLLGKQNVYEASIHIPLIMAGPRIPAGRRVDDLVYQHSMYRTTCELAGVPVPAHVEFPSLAGLATGKSNAPVHDAVFSYYKDFVRTVRTPSYKLTLYPKIDKVQLFHLEEDPWEMHDLSEDPAQAGRKKELFARLRKWQEELDDPLDLMPVARRLGLV